MVYLLLDIHFPIFIGFLGILTQYYWRDKKKKDYLKEFFLALHTHVEVADYHPLRWLYI